MRILIACECSGIVRDAFIKRGHDAISCDLKPTERPGPHYQGDVRDLLSQQWDAMIAFPECTYVCGSGIHWNDRGRGWDKTNEALDFFRLLWGQPIPKIAIENPVGIISSRIEPPTQSIQPYEFNEDASKRTCLWLKGFPKLVPTKRFPPRLVIPWIPCPEECGDYWCVLHRKHVADCPCKPIDDWAAKNKFPYEPCVERWSNQTDGGQNRLGPSEQRAALRSETYPGIADAMADQWGSVSNTGQGTLF